MSKIKVRPHYHTPDTDIADNIGVLDVQLRDLQTKIKGLKDEFALRGLVKVEGDCFTVLRSDVVRNVLNVEALEEAIGKDQLDEYRTESHSTKFTIRASEKLAEAA
jgi:hypothetical protein